MLNLPEKKSFFLFGPRGTGKTTWVRQRLPQALQLDLLEAELFNDLLARPQRLENLIPRNFSDWIVIDEVQRIPDLLNEVHRLIEKYRYRFALTGSSPRKLKLRNCNLLAGRALNRAMHQLTAAELGDDFKLEHSLKFGQLPCAYTENDPQAYLESYVRTYLDEEIKQEGLTRNLGVFSRFLEAASLSQGGVLNISQVSRDCAVERKVVENYFAILEDLLIASRVKPFTKRAKRRLAQHPKFYFFDTGVFRTLRPAGPLDEPEFIDGQALETLLLSELRALNDYLNLGYTIYYWRTADQLEVDLVLYGPRGIKAFEIKRTARLASSYFTGLKAFRKDYPQSSTYFLYGGDRKLQEGDIEILPVADAFKNLADLL